MRARNIKPSFFRNELLAEMTPDIRLLFIGMWCMADREGRVENRPTRIKLEVVPMDSINVASAIKELEEKGFIKTYEADGKSVIQIINFLKHQNPHSTERDSLLPDESGSYVVNKRKPNGQITGDFELSKCPLTVKRQLINSSSTVNEPSLNALNPESCFLKEDSKDIGSAKADRSVRFSAKKYLVDRGVEPKLADEYITVRKAKKLANTETAFDLISSEVEKTQLAFAAIIKTCVENSWGGFKASWLDTLDKGGKTSAVNEHIAKMMADGFIPKEAA